MGAAAPIISLIGTVVSTAATIDNYNKQADMAQENAQRERLAAEENAKRIRAAVERRKSEARAATAASGTNLDEFAAINVDEIERLGSMDEAMARLSGASRARVEEMTARNYSNAAVGAGFQGLGQAASNWKTPAKKTTPDMNYGGPVP